MNNVIRFELVKVDPQTELAIERGGGSIVYEMSLVKLFLLVN
jgi:hypothetical protein